MQRHDIAGFRGHVDLIGLQSSQGSSKDLDAGPQRRLQVYQDEGAAAERAKPTAGGDHGREWLKPHRDTELTGDCDEFVEKTGRVHPQPAALEHTTVGPETYLRHIHEDDDAEYPDRRRSDHAERR